MQFQTNTCREHCERAEQTHNCQLAQTAEHLQATHLSAFLSIKDWHGWNEYQQPESIPLVSMKSAIKCELLLRCTFHRLEH